MSNTALADLDAELHDAFASEGWADVCEFQPRAGSAVPNVRCYADRRTLNTGEFAEVSQRGVRIELIRQADLPRPAQRDVIVLGQPPSLERLAVDVIVDEDESRYVVLCTRAPA